ncbi:MAG: DUF5683 domain-containing protein [Bacteroidota bacterium]|jgi:hypothetical protein
MRRTLLLLLLMILGAVPLRAQEDTTRIAPKKDDVAPPLGLDDSLGITVKKGARSPGERTDDSMRITLKEGIATEEEDTLETKSGMGAVIRSAIFPGWGQFYNESYWKIPIVLGVTGFLVWGVVTEHTTFKDYERRYAATITEEEPSGTLLLKRYREFYRDRRDTYGWWLLVTYLLQLADAYVDAALFSFDVSDEAVIMLIPQPGGMGMQIRF